MLNPTPQIHTSPLPRSLLIPLTPPPTPIHFPSASPSLKPKQKLQSRVGSAAHKMAMEKQKENNGRRFDQQPYKSKLYAAPMGLKSISPATDKENAACPALKRDRDQPMEALKLSPDKRCVHAPHAGVCCCGLDSPSHPPRPPPGSQHRQRPLEMPDGSRTDRVRRWLTIMLLGWP